MPLPSASNKPLLLFFPIAQTTNYKRCLSIAQHLRKHFTIQFLHTDNLSSLVYQQGFDTFSISDLSFRNSSIYKNTLEFHKGALEVQFLEQVETLEILQPTLLISDGIASSNMASEFTGIPLISLLNGYQSPYFVKQHTITTSSNKHTPFIALREKYGLSTKQSLQEEFEGNLNWICDLPELFPQKALPSHYEMIGPILENFKRPVLSTTYNSSSIKKTIFLDHDFIDRIRHLKKLEKTFFEQCNIVVNTSTSNNFLSNHPKVIRVSDIAQLSPKIDLVFCNTECMVYEALSYGIPVIYAESSLRHRWLIDTLENWKIGTSWDHLTQSNNGLEYWIHNKSTDELRTIQYKIKASFTTLSYKLLSSIALHFPFLQKTFIPIL
ncbi:MAG TPA: hypothetical protein VD794_09070 [Flavisolibacter sp.]|nr:hypothetical protein [Flavisolibacter sp.]